jgi:HSP20 family protein
VSAKGKSGFFSPAFMKGGLHVLKEHTMNHIKIRIGKDLSSMDTALSRTIDTMFRMMNPQFTLSRHTWHPHTDIFEMDSEIIITSEIAGVDISDIHLETDLRTLKFYGIRREMPHREDGSYLLAEIPSGYFERTFILSSPIDAETVTASYSQGMLQIRLKKLTDDRIHNIIVRSL